MNSFQWSVSSDGLIISLVSVEKSFLKSTNKLLPVEEWESGGDTSVLIGLAALTETIQDLEDMSATSVLLPHTQVAGLNEQQAQALNLPLSVPYQLRVWSEGRVLDNSIQLQSEFLDMARPIYVDNRIGSILMVGHSQYRIPSPLF